MSDGYRVNTDELEAVVKRLRALQQNIGQTANKSKYNTVVARGDFGGDFAEAQALHSAHDSMHQSLNDMIGNLDALISDFGDKTHSVATAYRSREEEHAAAMNRQQDGIA